MALAVITLKVDQPVSTSAGNVVLASRHNAPAAPPATHNSNKFLMLLLTLNQMAATVLTYC